MKNNIPEILIASTLVVLAFILLDPFGAFMPTSTQMMVLILFLVLFTAFFGLIWREKASDERENLHRLIAGRMGYLLGSSGLVVGIAIQSFSHQVDPWLIISLILMLLGKTVSLIRSNRTQ